MYLFLRQLFIFLSVFLFLCFSSFSLFPFYHYPVPFFFLSFVLLFIYFLLMYFFILFLRLLFSFNFLKVSFILMHFVYIYMTRLFSFAFPSFFQVSFFLLENTSSFFFYKAAFLPLNFYPSFINLLSFYLSLFCFIYSITFSYFLLIYFFTSVHRILSFLPSSLFVSVFIYLLCISFTFTYDYIFLSFFLKMHLVFFCIASCLPFTFSCFLLLNVNGLLRLIFLSPQIIS